LGPLLFCLSIHLDPMYLQSELVATFTDDLTVGAPTDTVAANVEYITPEEKSSLKSKVDGSTCRNPK